MNKTVNRKFLIGIGVAVTIAGIGAYFGLASDKTPLKPASYHAQEEGIHEYDVTEASDHIGERAVVKGTIYRVTTTKSGVTFIDFCEGFKKCQFSAVIFASDLKNFPDVASYKGDARLHGVIRSYKGQAEMVLNSPEDIDI